MSVCGKQQTDYQIGYGYTSQCAAVQVLRETA